MKRGSRGVGRQHSLTVLEQLWFGPMSGDPAEQEAARSLAATVAEIQGLRPFSPAVQRLLSAVQDEFYTVAEITKIIEAATSLTARVMRMVNSAASGLRQRCKSIDHAIALLGANTISSMAAAMAILDMFSGKRGPAAVVSEHSAAVGASCRVLARACNIREQDALSTAGILHDVGKLLLLQVSDSLTIGGETDPYPALVAKHSSGPDALHKREREVFGFDHAVLAGHVLRAWQLPDPVPQIVAWHHQPERAFGEEGNIARLVAALRLADRTAYELTPSPEPDLDLIDELTKDPASKVLGLNDEQFASLWEDLHEASKTTVSK